MSSLSLIRIFFLWLRGLLAQTQLQLAQSNPQLHNLHEAWRMYQALEVQNIDPDITIKERAKANKVQISRMQKLYKVR